MAMYGGVDFSDKDLEDLKTSKQILLSPSLAAKLGDILGNPIEKGLSKLPKNWSDRVAEATQAALFKALELSTTMMDGRNLRPSRDWLHKGIVVTSGIASGAAGFSTVLIELPFSTGVMLRSIADIARSEGFDISLVETKLACIEVFAFGDRDSADAGAEAGYWGIRAGLAAVMKESAIHIAKKGLTEKSAPVLVRLIAAVAARFSGIITMQAAALAVPVVGAISGGAVNYMFIDHFQDLARAHFIIKRLEGVHGPEAVREAYDALSV